MYKMRKSGFLVDIHWKFRGHLMKVSNLHDGYLMDVSVLCGMYLKYKLYFKYNFNVFCI